jgi:hypothetical protein
MINKLGIIASAKRTANLLLDVYPDANHAFSLRKLRTAYDGFVVKVRDDSTDNEADVSFDGNDTVSDSSAVSNLTGGSGATLGAWRGSNVYVVKWYDQSSNGHDVAESSQSFQPKLISSGNFYVDGGNSRVSMRGHGDRLIESTSSTIDQPITVVAVTDVWQANVQRYLCDGGQATSAGDREILILLNTDFEMYAGSFAGSRTVTVDNWQWFALFNGSSSELSMNGTNEASLSIGTKGCKGLTLFSRYNAGNTWRGTMQEFVQWEADRSADRSAIETAINEYYATY